MNCQEKDVEEKTRDLPEPVKTLVAVCMRNTDCGEEEIELLRDPSLQLPLKFYLYACIADKYPMKILKELSECTSNTALQKRRKSYEANVAASGFLMAARQTAADWQSRAETVLCRAEELVARAEKTPEPGEPDQNSFPAGVPEGREPPEDLEVPEDRKLPAGQEQPSSQGEKHVEDEAEDPAGETMGESGRWGKRARLLAEENQMLREQISVYRQAILRWKKLAEKKPTRPPFFWLKVPPGLLASLQAFQLAEELPADPEELRTEFMVRNIRDGNLTRSRLEILERGYGEGFSIQDLQRLLESGGPEEMEQAYSDIMFGRQRMAALLDAAESRRKKQGHRKG